MRKIGNKEKEGNKERELEWERDEKRKIDENSDRHTHTHGERITKRQKAQKDGRDVMKEIIVREK